MLYFAYGSNLNTFQMSQRCPDSAPLQKGVLEGYELVFQAGVATVRENPMKKVQGGIYEISLKDRNSLDRYEGYPYLYDREWKEITVPNDRKVICMLYVMKKEHLPLPTNPTIQYVSTIRNGYYDWDLDSECLDEALDKIYIR